MHRYVRVALIGLVAHGIVGCATTPLVPFEGASIADSRLKNDTYNMVSVFTKAKGCEKIEKVKTQIVQPASGLPNRMSWKERWTVYGCNKEFAYDVTYTGDGVGGTFFSIRSP